MTTQPTQRRVLYIRHRRTLDLSEGYRMNQDEWVETMSALADVTVMTDDFDMADACARIRPDFILYESPPLHPAPLRITNPRACAEIPRIGFQMQDAYCATRVYFLRRMQELGIRYMFTHMTDMALRQSPELGIRTFSIPHLFDETLFRDYGLAKDIPVSIFGAGLMPSIYNWRAAIVADIADYFPTLLYTHPGYIAPTPRHKFPVSGIAYAHLLNRSHFSLADTTRFDCLLRKHLEIPACGAVLVAPDASSLAPYGFRDMENCILGSGKELYDKIGAVADNPDAYQRIRNNGHDLVHRKYGRRHWRGILDFYECLRNLQPGQTIRQNGIFGAFEIIAESPIPLPAMTAAYPANEISSLRHLWMQYLLRGEGGDRLTATMTELADFLGEMTEHWLPLGIAALLQGDAAKAKQYFQTPQMMRKSESGFTDYDPEEIAWLSLAAALTGDGELLALTSAQSASMRHLTLRRMQWLGHCLAGSANPSQPPTDVLARNMDDDLSIHWTGQLELKDWQNLIQRILTANGQAGPSFN